MFDAEPHEELPYVYGIVASGTKLPRWDDGDLGGRTIAMVERERLAAVVEYVAAGRSLATRADLLAHSGVLNAIAAEGDPVVPLQFGSLFADEADVVDRLLSGDQDRWVGLLERLRTVDQFTLRARYVQESVLAEIVREDPEIAALRAETSGLTEDASYAARVNLGERVAHAVELKREADTDDIIGLLAPCAVEHRVTEGAGLDQIVDIAFLVSKEGREDFEATAEQLAAVMHERARFKLLGPLAPFDFVLEG